MWYDNRYVFGDHRNLQISIMKVIGALAKNFRKITYACCRWNKIEKTRKTRSKYADLTNAGNIELSVGTTGDDRHLKTVTTTADNWGFSSIATSSHLAIGLQLGIADMIM